MIRRSPLASRYSYARVALEIARRLAKEPRGTRARLARVLGIDRSAITHRIGEARGERFSADELSAPPGWPILSWEEGEALTALRRALESAAKTRGGG